MKLTRLSDVVGRQCGRFLRNISFQAEFSLRSPMSRWLARASRGFSRPSQNVPEPFEVPCICGSHVRGLRGTESQLSQCTDCGTSIFVLPGDVYPPLKPVAPRKGDKKKKPPKQPRSDGKQIALSTVVRKERTPIRRRMKKKARQVGTQAAVLLRRAAARPKAIFTPFRLVIIAIIGVIATTIYFGWHERVLETAHETIRDESEQGALFLSQRDFPAAETAFRKATESVERLRRAGQEHPKAAYVLQMFHESHAATNLSERSLFNIVRDAQRELDTGRSRTDDFLSSAHAGGWIIMETDARIPPDHQEQAGTIFAFSMPLEGKQVLITTDRRVFESRLLGQGQKRVIFAAQLDSCRLADSDARKWVITLRSDTAFLWSSFENLQGVGFIFDNKAAGKQVQRLLSEQSSLMGVSP